MYCMLGSVTLLQPAFCSVVVKCKKKRKKVKKDVGLKSRGMGEGEPLFNAALSPSEWLLHGGGQ